MNESQSPPHLLLVHQSFAGPDEAGGTRHSELARRLVAKGARFTIVASDRSPLTGQRVAGSETDGIRVRRAFTPPAFGRNLFWRAMSFAVFALSSIVTALRAGAVDVVIGTTPPMPQAFTAWLVARIRGAPFLLEVRDLWPDFAVDMGVLKSPLLIHLARRLEHFLYHRADHVLVNSPAYVAHVVGTGIALERVSCIPNGVEPDMFTPDAAGKEFRARFGLEKKTVLAYAGAMGLANDLGTLIEAASLVRDEPAIQVVLIGDGRERAHWEAEARARGLTNVTFTGPLPKSEMPSALAACDACIAILKDIPMFRTTYPNKVFDYMAAGRPVLLAINGVIRAVVETAGAGLIVAPGDPRALAAAMRAVHLAPDRLRAMGSAGRACVVEHFDRAKHALALESLVARLRKRS